MSYFVPVSSPRLSFISRRYHYACDGVRVTSGACTRSCNPWKIINTRVTPPPLSFSLPFRFAPSKKRRRVRSVRLVCNKWSCGTTPWGVLFRCSSPSPTQACLNNAISFLGIFRLSSRGGTSLLMARLCETKFLFFFITVDWWRESEQKNTCMCHVLFIDVLRVS